MVEIKFAHRFSEYDPCGDDIMIPRTINEMENEWIELYDEYGKPKLNKKGIWLKQKNRIQMSHAIKRICGELLKAFQYWNCCVYADLDTKLYFNDFPDEFPPEKQKELLDKVTNYLIENYPDIFYYKEVSQSGKGLHIIFYFDCPKTEEWFNICTKTVFNIITDCFIKFGYEHIIKYVKGLSPVYDEHTKSFGQLCYITKKDMVFNDKCTGNIESCKDEIDRAISIIKAEEEEEKAEQMLREIKQQEWLEKQQSGNGLISKIEKFDVSSRPPYIEHTFRWKLYMSLYYYYGDQVKEEWKYVAKIMTPGNGHDERFYLSEPYGDWYNKLSSGSVTPTPDAKLLNSFGYKTVYINKKASISTDALLDLDLDDMFANIQK